MKFLALFLATAVAALLAGTAGAADPAPTFSGCGTFKKDSNADAGSTDPVSSESGAPDEAEIEEGWISADSNVFALRVKKLSETIPPPATSLTYNVKYEQDGVKFVRAHQDFSGTVVYEYGHLETVSAGGVNNNRYARDGETTGTFTPGDHGVVSMVIPPEVGGKAGTALKAVMGEAQVGRTTVVPGAAPTPTRGLGYLNDDVSLGNLTLGPCAAGGTPTTTTPTTTTTTTTTPAAQQSAPLPVKLASKSIKKAKKGKTVKVKLRSSEPLTSVAVRIAKGTKAYGTGKLAKLGSKGTVKVKLTKALKKGTYSFDVAGTDAQGQRRVGSLKLKVK